MSDYDKTVSDDEKIKIVSGFIKNAPPGEFNEVFNDVRVLLNNDSLLKEGASSAFSDYNMEQFTPAKVDQDQVLITKYGKLDGSRFLDPRGKRQFKYDHLRKEASDIQPTQTDSGAEPYRAALDKAMSSYLKSHYPGGVLTVYGNSAGGKTKLVVCIEDHKYNAKNFWNGRWRSVWEASFTPGGSGELKGTVRAQVHYYEDGNVQLVSSKEINTNFNSTNEEATAKTLVKLIETEENDYQTALGDNYKTMSQTTFKALRRPLPITRTKFDWNKASSYKIGSELKGTAH